MYTSLQTDRSDRSGHRGSLDGSLTQRGSSFIKDLYESKIKGLTEEIDRLQTILKHEQTTRDQLIIRMDADTRQHEQERERYESDRSEWTSQNAELSDKLAQQEEHSEQQAKALKAEKDALVQRIEHNTERLASRKQEILDLRFDSMVHSWSRRSSFPIRRTKCDTAEHSPFVWFSARDCLSFAMLASLARTHALARVCTPHGTQRH